jgi:hypothetical protein
MRRASLNTLIAIWLFASVPVAAFAQSASTSQPAPGNPGFLQRFFGSYVDEFNPPPPPPAASGDQTVQAPSGRLPPPFPPAPLDSPPWPWTDWPFGGSPLLGGSTPNASGNNLMKALGGTSFGDYLKENNTEIWGWVDAGANLSTSHGADGNLPAGYDFNSNSAQLSQAVMYIERVPDTTQQDHVDWGFRFVQLYGTDYRFVTMEGVLSDSLTERNQLYAYDPAEFDVDVYIPSVGEGSNLRFGRYVTLPDIEADLDLQNPFFSHSYYYTYDPFTQFGAVWSTRLSKNWMVQVGINASNDTAPWAQGARPTGTACVQWNSDTSWDNIYVCANGTNSGSYGFNNVQFYVFTWYHKLTQRLWVATEDYYEYQTKVPAVGQPTIPDANPAICPAGVTDCTAGAAALSLYVMYQLSNRDFVGLRTEGFDDIRGQRTGFATWYNEETIGYVHWLTNSIEVRPEIRYDHAFAAPAFDNGARHTQLSVAADVLIKY